MNGPAGKEVLRLPPWARTRALDPGKQDVPFLLARQDCGEGALGWAAKMRLSCRSLKEKRKSPPTASLPGGGFQHSKRRDVGMSVEGKK